ncbi:MAG TPA: GntR family transcriptional regulator [Candidatus Dormibacteraeota bacterium]|jgi:DNA-binding GntR family transcriptional regulator|nr:GntR family transcriptional regulator [Candidatus Dormibacteraeota bacterium]
MSSRLPLQAIDAGASVTQLTYEALKQAIMRMPIYDAEADLRIDERGLAEDLRVSRTPIREAIARLEHEGLVRTVPRRGTYVVRKSRAEVIDGIMASAALEGVAALMATERASDEEIASLREIFTGFSPESDLAAKVDEYSVANVDFHRRIIELSKSAVVARSVEGLRIHVQAIRRRTIREHERFMRSIVDHLAIIEAMEARDGERAERLVREHAMGLAAHVRDHVHYLGEGGPEEVPQADE